MAGKLAFMIGRHELPSRRRDVLAVVLLIVLGAIWLWCVSFPFFEADDPYFVWDNPHIVRGVSLETVTCAFATTLPDYWHPLTWLSLALDTSLFGPEPWGYHLTSVLLHVANTLLLYGLLRKLTGSVGGSLLVAAVFCIHPQRIESVAWISERKDVLAGFFGLLAFLTWVRYVRTRNRTSYLLTCFLFALSLMAKPLLVMFPMLLLLLDYWPLNRFAETQNAKLETQSGGGQHAQTAIEGRRLFRVSSFGCRIFLEKLPLFLLAAASALNTLLSTSSSGFIHGTPFSSMVRALGNYGHYLRDTIYFGGLVFFPRAENSVSPAFAMLSAVLLLVMTVLAIILERRDPRARPVLVGWLWFLIAMLPTSGIFQAGYSMRGDRFTYIPAIGLLIALVFGLAPLLKIFTRRSFAIITGSLIVALLVPFTLQRLALWKDPLALYEHDLALDPNNAYLEIYAAHAARRQNLPERAAQHFRRASQLDPREFPPHR